MPVLYDENGNEQKDALPVEEVQKLKTEIETHKKTLEQKDKDLTEIKGKLAGMENKDFNYKKLRDLTEIEKKELSTKELELMKRQEKLEEEQSNFKKEIVESHKKDMFAVFAGEDEELRKKVEYHYNRFSGDAVTKEEISQRMKDAYDLATRGQNRPNPLNKAFNMSGQPPKSKDNGEISDEVRELGRKMGITDEDFKKYGKK